MCHMAHISSYTHTLTVTYDHTQQYANIIYTHRQTHTHTQKKRPMCNSNIKILLTRSF